MKKIVVAKDEEKHITLLWTGKETELDYRITLAEPGAKVTFSGLLLGKAHDSLAINVDVIHAAPETQSEVVIKAALTESAKADIQGLVKIDPGAKGTKTWLAAHMLLLSDSAKGVAVPSLEILENDVKAGHATTVGRLSDLELFYLMSRGIPRNLAQQLIVHGFLQDMIDKLPKPLAAKAAKELEHVQLV